MKIQVGSPGWRTAEVYLDGVYQKYCTYANEEKGYIVRAKLNDEGKTMLNPIKDEYRYHPSENELVLEKVFGKVKIKT